MIAGQLYRISLKSIRLFGNVQLLQAEHLSDMPEQAFQRSSNPSTAEQRVCARVTPEDFRFRSPALSGVILAFSAAILFTAPVSSSAGKNAGNHNDDIVDANAFPWSSISKVYNSARSSCTGSVVAPGKALTAAHCLFNPATRRFLQSSSLHLLFGYDKGEYRVHARVSSYIIPPEYEPGNVKASLLYDWALLTLAEPVANGTTPIPLSARPAVAGDPLMIGGFSQLHPFMMTADTDCRMRAVLQNGILVHNCSVLPGDSGAPVLTGSREKSVEVIGIQVASAEWTGSKVGLAVPITSIAASMALPATESHKP